MLWKQMTFQWLSSFLFLMIKKCQKREILLTQTSLMTDLLQHTSLYLMIICKYDIIVQKLFTAFYESTEKYVVIIEYLVQFGTKHQIQHSTYNSTSWVNLGHIRSLKCTSSSYVNMRNVIKSNLWYNIRSKTLKVI